MSWSTGLSWLAALKSPLAPQEAAEPEPADMGTAFGLDASFGPVEYEPQSPSLPPCWEDRLTRRCGL